jgi:hypothetical protein
MATTDTKTTPRKSKLDSCAHMIGTLPDKEVAEKAGVTAENVRTYRIRRSIPAAWRGETLEDLARKQSARTKGKRPSAPKQRKPRASRLDPWKHLLGELPDKQLAEMAGVSAENVRSYRLRRGISARWRGEGAEQAQAIVDRTVGVVEPINVPAQPGMNGSRWAFRVVADVEGSRREFVAFAPDMASAARHVGQELSERHPKVFLREISVVGEAL